MYNLTGSRIPQEVRNDTKGSGNAVEALCEDKGLDREELVEKLASIEYEYDEERNQFV